MFEQVQAGISRVLSNPQLKAELAGWKRTVLIRVSGENYTIRVDDGSLTVTKEKTRHPDVEIQLDRPTFMEIATGKLPFTTAYLRGRLNVKGNVQASDITRLQKLL